MATYQYRCREHGTVDAQFPMGAAAAAVACPACGGPSARVFSSPMLHAGDARARRLIEATTSTSDRPEVVTSIPSAGRRRTQPMAPPNPMLQKLPRP